MVLPKSKMSFASQALSEFINRQFIDGYDRCMVATFNDRFNIGQDFTPSKSRVLSALANLESSVGGGTLLYDSMKNMCTAFWKSAHRDRPWVWVTMTDGQDNRSKEFSFNEQQSPARLGRYILDRFTFEPSNYPFLVGCGKDGELNEEALAMIGHFGGFPAITVEGITRLQDVFQNIAHTLAAEVENGLTIHGTTGVLRRTVRPRVFRLPIEIGLLIDCSASMGDPPSKAHLN
jgi:hypothetical protein